MPKFRKAILRANRIYKSPDGDVTVTPERLKHWSDTFGQFQQAGLDVPIHWDHSDDPTKNQPVKRTKDGKRRSAKDIVGFLDRLDLSDDGSSAEIVIDVRRPADVEKVRNNLASVSPVIFDKFADGDGKEWQDCFVAVDLVSHPVDHRQSEFTEAVACGIRLGVDTGDPKLYQLAMDDKEKSKPEPENPGADRLQKVLTGLAALNIVLSDDTNEENLLEHLEQALLTATAMEAEEDQQMAVEQSPEVAAMSLKLEQHEARINKQHRDHCRARLSHLLESGRCTPAEHKEREPQLESIKLSLDDGGNAQPSAIEAWIDSREAVPQGTFWDGETRTVKLGQMEESQHPETARGTTVTDEEADEMADHILGANR